MNELSQELGEKLNGLRRDDADDPLSQVHTRRVIKQMVEDQVGKRIVELLTRARERLVEIRDQLNDERTLLLNAFNQMLNVLVRVRNARFLVACRRSFRCDVAQRRCVQCRKRARGKSISNTVGSRRARAAHSGI